MRRGSIMRRLFLPFLAACCLLCYTACQEVEREPLYKSISILGVTMHIDGKLTEKVWDQAYWETGFSFPWQTLETPSTSFCSVSSSDHLYFAFKVVDHDIVFATGPLENERGVAQGDRVEIFFSKDTELTDYYGLEMSPKGRVLDYHASFYRQIDRSWNCEGLQIATQLVEDGYVVEGAIPFSTLIRLGLAKPGEENRILTGLFRGEFSHGPDETIIQRWISWIIPDSNKPDFHIPSAFGYLEVSVGTR